MVNIRLHNTLSRQKEDFVPADPQRITMYVCGPTVYNYVHIAMPVRWCCSTYCPACSHGITRR